MYFGIPKKRDPGTQRDACGILEKPEKWDPKNLAKPASYQDPRKTGIPGP